MVVEIEGEMIEMIEAKSEVVVDTSDEIDKMAKEETSVILSSSCQKEGK
jgi:hypothetical protein